MATFIFTLIFITCILLILVVLVQNSKGGGLDSTFGQGNQILGVKQTTDWLEKATWGLAITLVVLCVFSASLNTPQNLEGTQSSEIKDLVNSEAITPPPGL
jgi:preprotein translocase subunit SecG